MSANKVTRSAANKFSPSRIVKTLTEALMVKTGIKSGPEFTAGS
jgi:hypothetical protein